MAISSSRDEQAEQEQAGQEQAEQEQAGREQAGREQAGREQRDGTPVVVAVVGSARLAAPDPRWEQARELGAALGARGWRVMTGGYGGLMEAAARGGREAGATVVGLPMRGWTGLTPSRWCDELRWAGDYGERSRELLSCDAVVALDGGIGTLAETTAVWAALQTEPGSARLVLLGASWPALLSAFGGTLVADPADLELAVPAATVGQAVDLLAGMVSGARAHPPGPRG